MPIPWPIIEPLPGCWFIIDPPSGWLFCWLSCCACALTVTAIAASKTTATTAAFNALREIAEKFYPDLRTKERETAAATLTAEAQKLGLGS